MAQTVEDLCQAGKITYAQLVEKSGLEETRVQAILLQRWTPSPFERQKIAAVFGVLPDEIVWGHATPIQHLYGSGPG
jgi:transcriptional regulator with XRE-family HTH domain